jgi:hypothetical protein
MAAAALPQRSLLEVGAVPDRMFTGPLAALAKAVMGSAATRMAATTELGATSAVVRASGEQAVNSDGSADAADAVSGGAVFGRNVTMSVNSRMLLPMPTHLPTHQTKDLSPAER